MYIIKNLINFNLSLNLFCYLYLDDNPGNEDNVSDQENDDHNDDKKCINLRQKKETKNGFSLDNSKFGSHQKQKTSNTLDDIISNQTISNATVDFIQYNQECQTNSILSPSSSSEVVSNLDSTNVNSKATCVANNQGGNINSADNCQEPMQTNLTRQYSEINETLPPYNNQNISSCCCDQNDLLTKTEVLSKMSLSKAPGYPRRVNDDEPNKFLSHQKMPYKELVCFNSLPLINNLINNCDKVNCVENTNFSSNLESKMYSNNEIDTTCDNFSKQMGKSNSPETNILPALESKVDDSKPASFENQNDNFKPVSCDSINQGLHQLTLNHMEINLDFNTIAKEAEGTS